MMRPEIRTNIDVRFETRAVSLRTETGKQHLHLLESAFFQLLRPVLNDWCLPVRILNIDGRLALDHLLLHLRRKFFKGIEIH